MPTLSRGPQGEAGRSVERSPGKARRLLMVCYYFPPLGGIGSLRPAKLAKYLPDFGWEPTVISPANGSYFRDDSIEVPAGKVMRTGTFELSRLGKRVIGQPEELKPATVGPVLGAVRTTVRELLYFPDSHVGWYPFAVRSGNRVLATSEFDAVLSSSGPVTTHLVGRHLAKRHSLPWVAEFRDTWAEPRDNNESSRLNQRRARRLERSLVSDASAVVVPSPSWGELFEAKGAQKVGIVTNGYEPADLPALKTPPETVLTHIGSLHPGFQDLRPVWAALQRLRSSGGAPVKKLLFVGHVHDVIRRQLAEHGLDDMVEITGFVSHRDAMARMMGSSALLVAGGGDDRPVLRGVIPGKIFEYLASGLPILYVGRTDADPARILMQFPGCFIVGPGDSVGVESALKAIDRGPVVRDTSVFTWRVLAGRVAETLDAVAEGS